MFIKNLVLVALLSTTTYAAGKKVTSQEIFAKKDRLNVITEQMAANEAESPEEQSDEFIEEQTKLRDEGQAIKDEIEKYLKDNNIKNPNEQKGEKQKPAKETKKEKKKAAKPTKEELLKKKPVKPSKEEQKKKDEEDVLKFINDLTEDLGQDDVIAKDPTYSDTNDYKVTSQSDIDAYKVSVEKDKKNSNQQSADAYKVKQSGQNSDIKPQSGQGEVDKNDFFHRHIDAFGSKDIFYFSDTEQAMRQEIIDAGKVPDEKEIKKEMEKVVEARYEEKLKTKADLASFQTYKNELDANQLEVIENSKWTAEDLSHFEAKEARLRAVLEEIRAEPGDDAIKQVIDNIKLERLDQRKYTKSAKHEEL